MFSFNNQSASTANFSTSIQDGAQVPPFSRFSNWTQQAAIQPENLNIPEYGYCKQPLLQYQQYQCQENSFFSNEIPRQINEVIFPVNNSLSFSPTFQPQSTPERSHQARINLVPNTSGGYNMIVKRKRKRTMFTTEQVEALEAVFQRKPYVTRDDREVLVRQLQLTDISVKVWFQNRRLRGKKAAEEADEQALYEHQQAIRVPTAGDHTYAQIQTSTEQSFYSLDSNYEESTTSSGSSTNTSYLDNLESELMQNVDETGYARLNDALMEKIVTAINNVLPADFNLDNMEINSSSEDCNESKEFAESDESKGAAVVYEAISPAASPSSEQSLQRLFD